MLSIHFPSKIPINILRVLLHALFSSVDPITWVTLESHFFKTVTPNNLSKSETVTCSISHEVNNEIQISFKKWINWALSVDNFTQSRVVRAEQQRTNFLEETQKLKFLLILISCLLATQSRWDNFLKRKVRQNVHKRSLCWRNTVLKTLELEGKMSTYRLGVHFFLLSWDPALSLGNLEERWRGHNMTKLSWFMTD